MKGYGYSLQSRYSGVQTRLRSDIENFCNEIGRLDLAEIVEHPIRRGLKRFVKKEKTYKTGQREYFRFAEEVNKDDAHVPFLPESLSRMELYLAFYIAYLVLRPIITKGSTILAYR